MEDDLGHFSRRSRGGMIASRIDSQDVVAAILSVEALACELPGIPSPRDAEITLLCEGLEDLEFHSGPGMLYVLVKDQLLTMEIMRTQVETISENYGGDLVGKRFRICGLRGRDATVGSFAEDIGHLRTRLGLGADGDGWVQRDFVNKWRVPPEVALTIDIDTRDMRADSVQANALFAHAIRKTFPVSACTDAYLLRMLTEIVQSILAPARRQRGGVSLRQLEHQILAQLSPPEVVTFQTKYLSTQLGYIPDVERERAIRREGWIVWKARRNGLRRWRRHTFWERIRMLPIRCLYCNHPMLGNLNGRSGYLCPDCGYFPFMTLFYACDCGEPVALIEQPDLNGLGILAQVAAIIRKEEIKCPQCWHVIEAMKINTRLFMLGIPWPLDGSVDRQLILMRESIGRGLMHLTPDAARQRMLEAQTMLGADQSK